MKNKFKILIIICIILAIITGIVTYLLYKEKEACVTISENEYNRAFHEVVDYMENVKTYLAKSLISNTPEHGAITLTNLWRESNLARKLFIYASN